MKLLFGCVILFIMSFISSSNETICTILKKVPTSDLHAYHPDIKFGFEEQSAIKLDKEMFEVFFERKMSDVDTCFLIGKFQISKSRIGVISYSITKECDHTQDFFSLHVIENCELIGTKQIMYSDHDFIFNTSSRFSKNFDILTIRQEEASEYANENSKFDTLYYAVYKIDLKSKLLDTISKTNSFKLLKPPPK